MQSCPPGSPTGCGGAAGFRNVVVHDYVDADDDLVLARLADPSDLALFVEAVTVWLRIAD